MFYAGALFYYLWTLNGYTDFDKPVKAYLPSHRPHATPSFV